jgi:hypothetical protein
MLCEIFEDQGNKRNGHRMFVIRREVFAAVSPLEWL